MADSPKPAGAKKALSAVLTECFNRWKDAIGALAAVLVAAINLMNYISSRWPIITFLITVITWFIALRIITARTNDRREAISEEHAYRDVPRTQAKYVVIALPVVTAIGFMIYTSTITAFGAAIVQSFSYLFAQVLVIALVLAAYVWAFALRTVTAKKQLDQTAKALRGYMYSDEERRVAKWFAIGVPSIIILGLTAYFAWPSIFWPSNRVVLATAEFNELRSISDDKSISSDCDVGAALAEALESSTSGTGYPIMVEHFHYAVPGYGYNAHSWARLYAYLSRSQVVIYGHYWKATGGEVYVQPKVSLITNFDNRLHHTSNIEAVALPIITVKGDQLCTPDPNILVASS